MSLSKSLMQKMRLANQSQEASAQYIAALNSQQLLFVSYDAQGQAVKENLYSKFIVSIH